jgi:hypothetical protein
MKVITRLLRDGPVLVAPERGDALEFELLVQGKSHPIVASVAT